MENICTQNILGDIMKTIKVKGGGTIEVHADIDSDTVSKEIADSLVKQGWAKEVDNAKAKTETKAKAQTKAEAETEAKGK